MRNSELEDLYRGVQPDMHRPKPSPDALAAALEAAQRLAAEADAEQAADDTDQDANESITVVCKTCGYRNRTGNKFCGMCGNAFQIQMMSLVRGPWQAGRMEPKRITTITIIITIISPEHRME